MKYSDFMSQLTEAATSTKQLKHLSHFEELIFEEGSSAVVEIITSIESFLSVFQQRQFTDKAKLTTKWDGSPSVIIHDKDGDFWVASKSAFNKDPKLNRTPADIEKNHGHAPGLVEKLKYALKYCKGLGINGTVQGDFLYTDTDLKTQMIDGENHIVFKPNTIVYAVPVKSDLGKQILASKMGIIIHTEYDEDLNTKTIGAYSVAKLKKNKNVFFDDAQIKDITSEVSLTKEENAHVFSALEKIKSLQKSIPSKFLDELANHPEIAPLMAKYNNANVRAGSYATPAVAKGFAKYIHDEMEKEISKIKTASRAQEKRGKREQIIAYVESNMKNLVATYELYSVVTDVKLLLLKKLNKLSPLMKSFTMSGEDMVASPVEGFVAIVNGKVFKLVDRLDFSLKNFMARPRGPAPTNEDFMLESKNNTVVFCFGRSNPPHLGHKLMFDKTVSIARQKGADYQIWISKTQDKKKNPLDINSKIKWLRKIYPDIVFHPATTELPSMIQILKHLNTKYKNLVMVAGSDRIGEYEDLIGKYNGKEYNYDSVEVVSAGERDPDAEGVSGMSATKMRNAAIQNDVKTFSMGLPKSMSKSDVESLMSDVRKGLALKESVEDIYQILQGKHPIEDPEDDIIQGAKMSKTKRFGDELMNSIDDDTESNYTQISYSDFMKMLDSKRAMSEAKDDDYDKDLDADEDGDVDDSDLDDIANGITDDDIMDLYHPDELALINKETGEEVDDEEENDEEGENEDEEANSKKKNESTNYEANENYPQALNEALSREARIKRRINFMRTKVKREKMLKIALRRVSSSKKISKRARVAAVKAVKKKLFKGRDLSTLSLAEKVRAENAVQRMAKSGALSRVAMKLIPKIRKLENERLHHKNFTAAGL